MLHVACLAGQLQVVKELLRAGACLEWVLQVQLAAFAV